MGLVFGMSEVPKQSCLQYPSYVLYLASNTRTSVTVFRRGLFWLEVLVAMQLFERRDDCDLPKLCSAVKGRFCFLSKFRQNLALFSFAGAGKVPVLRMDVGFY
jgi:hypothetical protein